MPEIFAKIVFDEAHAKQQAEQIQKIVGDVLSNKDAAKSAQVFQGPTNEQLARLKDFQKETTQVIKGIQEQTKQEKILLDSTKAFAETQNKVIQGQMKAKEAIKEYSIMAQNAGVNIVNLKNQIKTSGDATGELNKKLKEQEKILKEAANEAANYKNDLGDVNNYIKRLVNADTDLAKVQDNVNKGFITAADAAGKLKANAELLITTKKAELDQMKEEGKTLAEINKRRKEIDEQIKKNIEGARQYEIQQKKVDEALKSSQQGAMDLAEGFAKVGANLGSLAGVFGEFGKVPGLVANSVTATMKGIKDLEGKGGLEKALGFANIGLMAAQAAKQVFDVFDNAIKANEKKVIDAGKSAMQENLSIESFNLTNKSLTDRIDLVNKLAETNPKMAASLRGAIGSEKEFEEATRKAQQELKGLRQEGMSMEWKTEQTGGGLLGWLKSANSSIGSTAAQMGNFLVAMEDFRSGTATAMSKGAESLNTFASSVDGYKNRLVQMDIQIAEKQGDIAKSRELQLGLIRQEGEQLQKNLNLTILTLKAQQDQNRVSGGEAQTALANQRQILTADIAKLGGKFSNQIMQWVLNSVKETSVAAEDIFNKGTKTWQEWDKMLREIRSQDEGVYTKLWQSGAFEAASKAFIAMARGAKEIGEGNAGLAATIKELEGAYAQVPGLVGQIIDRQKILWGLETDTTKEKEKQVKVAKEKNEVKKAEFDIEKDFAIESKKQIDIENEKLEIRKKALQTQQTYYDNEKKITDIIAGKQAELDKLKGVQKTAEDQIREIGILQGKSSAQIEADVESYRKINNEIKQITDEKEKQAKLEKEAADRLKTAESSIDKIKKSLQDNALKIIDEREFKKTNDFLNQMLTGFPKVAGYTDELFSKMATDWEAVNRSIFDTTKKLEDERASFETSFDELIRQGKATLEEKKLWLEEYDKYMLESLKKEDAKRKEIVKNYVDGLEKGLKTESDKLNKMLDDYNKRIIDRENQTKDAKLKIGDYVYRQTHTAEENAVRDAVANYSKEYEEFRKAGVDKVDLAQWQALKQKELTKDFTDVQKKAFEAQKLAAIEASEAIVKAAQEAWEKQTKQQRDEINTQIDLVNQLKQAAFDAKNILLELLGQPVQTTPPSTIGKIPEAAPQKTTAGLEPRWKPAASFRGNTNHNGINWRWDGSKWVFENYIDNKGAPPVGTPQPGLGKAGMITPGDPEIGKNLIDIVKDSNYLQDLQNAWGRLGAGKTAADAFKDTIKKELVGVDGQGGLAAELKDDGKALMDFLAQGIKDGVISIEDALKKISEAFADYLEPHSPPKKGKLSKSDTWMEKIINLIAKGTLSDADIKKPFYMLADKIASSLGVGLDMGVIQAARDFKKSYQKSIAIPIGNDYRPQDYKNGVFGTEWQNEPVYDRTAWNAQDKKLKEFQAFTAALNMRPGSGLNWTDFEAGGKYADTEMAKIFSKNREFDVQNGTNGRIGLGTNMAKGLLESSWFKALAPKLNDTQMGIKYGQFWKQNTPKMNAFTGYDMDAMYQMLPYLISPEQDDSYWKLLNRVYYSMKELGGESGRDFFNIRGDLFNAGYAMQERFTNFKDIFGVDFNKMLTTDFAQQYQITNPDDASYGYKLWKDGQQSLLDMSKTTWLQNGPNAIDTAYARNYDEWSRAQSMTGRWNASDFQPYDSYAKEKGFYGGDTSIIRALKDNAVYIDSPKNTVFPEEATQGTGGITNIFYISGVEDPEKVATLVMEKMDLRFANVK